LFCWVYREGRKGREENSGSDSLGSHFPFFCFHSASFAIVAV
jgi:hypothetical protein